MAGVTVGGSETLKAGRMSAGQVGMQAAMALLVVLLAGAAHGQSAHRTRRESNANRKARIARTIAETYGHKYEAAGGGGYLRFRTGQYLRQSNEVTFWASTLYALNPKLGVQGEVRGAYGKAQIGNTIYNIANPRVSEYNFMAGPAYRFVAREKYSVSGFAEGGVGLGKFAGDSKGFSAQEIGVWTGDYAASFSAGVNLDYNVFPNLAVRLTPNYLGTTYGGTRQNSKSVNVGVVYRFGQKK